MEVGRKVRGTVNSAKRVEIAEAMHASHMDTPRESRKVLASLFPTGWQQAALEFGAVERLRGFSSAEALLRTLLLHVGL